MLTFKRKRHFNKFIIFCILMLFVVFTFVYLQALSELPNKLLIIDGKEYVFDLKMPFLVNLSQDKKVDLRLNGSRIDNGIKNINMMNQFTLLSNKNQDSTVNLNFKIFGFIPFKSMQVNVVSNKKLIPCGNSIGVKIHTDGALVVGTSKILGSDGEYYEPYNSSNINVGDYIIKINDTEIKNIPQITSVIEKTSGQPLKLLIKRKGSYIQAKVTPCKSSDGKYRIGLWLRDSTAGIGTLTFYDKENGIFGALGHGITDVDSGTLMVINNGEILSSSIVSIKKGYSGNPGELKGILMVNKGKGEVIKNTEYGIYGRVNNNSSIVPNNKAIPIALRNEIKEGPAQIITSINGNNISFYNIQIQKVIRQNIDSSKNMIIKITDKRLLDYTGGIVQGMSGSPIIQDGKLVGAVTHVLINDPTKGYGIFIESMIQKADSVINKTDELDTAS